MRSEPIEIEVATLRVMLDKLCGSEKIKELNANDTVKLEVLSRGRIQVSVRSTGEVFIIGK